MNKSKNKQQNTCIYMFVRSQLLPQPFQRLRLFSRCAGEKHIISWNRRKLSSEVLDGARLLIWHAYLGFLPKMSSWGHYFHEIYITWNLKNVVSVSYHTTDHSKMGIILVDSMLSFRAREPPIFSPLVPDCSSPYFSRTKKHLFIPSPCNACWSLFVHFTMVGYLYIYTAG